jgi:hypothetical protein
MPFDAAPVTFGDLMLDQSGEEPGGWPALLVGAFGEVWPGQFDRGQPQIVGNRCEYLTSRGGLKC